MTHAIDDFADAFVNLSLVGSLFISASVEASRDRILMYLVLAALPLAIAAPLVGPALDRTRLGYRATIAGSQLVRAVASVFLIGALLSLTLYPLAFVVLICRKVYALAKAALLTQITDDRNAFLRADAHVTRTGSVVGGAGVIVGGFLLAHDATAPMLVLAALLFLLASFVSRRLPDPGPSLHLASMARLRDVVPAAVWRATIAVTTIRAAAGALTFLLAFAIKQGGGDRWIFAGGLLVAGSGALLATFVSPWLHRPLEPDAVLVIALFVSGIVTAIGVVSIGNLGVLAIAFAIGLANGVASRSIAALQSAVPSIVRARTIARSELLFQLATLAGAGLAVQMAPSPRAGFAVASVALVAAGVAYTHRTRPSLRQQAARLVLGDQAPAVHETLPRALLVEAERLASLGAHRMAIVVADDAVQVILRRRRESPRLDVARWERLGAQIATVKEHDDQPDGKLVLTVLAEAERLVDATTSSGRRNWPGTRRDT